MSHHSPVLREREAARSSTRVGLLQVALAGVLWGTGGLALEVIRDHVPMSVLTVSAWRMVIATAALLAVLLVRRHAGAVVALLRQHPAYAVLVGVFTAAYQALYFASVVSVGVTVATVVSLGIAPVLLTVGEAVHRRRRPSAAMLAVLTTAIAGLLLVSAASGLGETGPRPLAGLLAALGSGTAFALTAALGRRIASTPHLSRSPPPRPRWARWCWRRSRCSAADRWSPPIPWPSAPSSTWGWSRWRSPTPCSTQACAR